MIVITYDSNRSAAMPAQSPTLSPTLSAIVAALRGSSSGMPASTFPTRSAPTSAALVKIPPPTLMNSAIREAPKPNPTRTAVAVFWKVNTITVAPSSPRPTHNMPVTDPVRNATLRASDIPPPRAAAAAVLTLPRTAMLMPMNPVRPDRVAPQQEAEHPEPARRPERKGDGAVGTDHLGRREEDEHGKGDDDHDDRPELPAQEGLGALLDGLGDVAHRSGCPGRLRAPPASAPGRR